MIKSKWIFIGWTFIWVVFSSFCIYLYNFSYNKELPAGIGFMSISLGLPAGIVGVVLAGIISMKFKLELAWQVATIVFFSYFFSLLFWLFIGKMINIIVSLTTRKSKRNHVVSSKY